MIFKLSYSNVIMEYYDLHVHTTQTIGKDSLYEMMKIAKRLGYHGIGYCKFFEHDLEWDSELKNIDLVKVCIIKASGKNELLKMIKKSREKAEIIGVYGGDYEINRVACECSMVDVLLHPELNRNDSGLDHICVRAASENNVAIEVNFREVLHTHGNKRVKVMKFMQRNIDLCLKYNARILITSGAQNRFEMRAPRDLIGLLYLLGVDINIAVDSMTTIPFEMIKINREKLSGKRYGGVSIEA